MKNPLMVRDDLQCVLSESHLVLHHQMSSTSIRVPERASGGRIEPPARLVRVRYHPNAALIHGRQYELRVHMPLIRGKRVQTVTHRFLKVLPCTEAREMYDPKVVLPTCMPLVGSESVQPGRFCAVYGCFGSQKFLSRTSSRGLKVKTHQQKR